MDSVFSKINGIESLKYSILRPMPAPLKPEIINPFRGFPISTVRYSAANRGCGIYAAKLDRGFLVSSVGMLLRYNDIAKNYYGRLGWVPGNDD